MEVSMKRIGFLAIVVFALFMAGCSNGTTSNPSNDPTVVAILEGTWTNSGETLTFTPTTFTWTDGGSTFSGSYSVTKTNDTTGKLQFNLPGGYYGYYTYAVDSTSPYKITLTRVPDAGENFLEEGQWTKQ
jgi:hypothetical protein